MANLKDLQEMAKNGEVSKKLLEDEEFKSELKKVLKEECGEEVTDEEIPEIIKDLEKNLIGEQKSADINKTISEEKLENVSGGKISKARLIKAVSTITGSVVAQKSYDKVYMSKFASEELKDYYKQLKLINSSNLTASAKAIQRAQLDQQLIDKNPDLESEIGKLAVTELGVGVGAGIGCRVLADYLCNKFGIE